MRYWWVLLLLSLFLFLLQQDYFLQREELFIALVSLVFFSLVFLFFSKTINYYFFYRYSLVYAIFYYLINLSFLYIAWAQLCVSWLLSLINFFESYLVLSLNIFRGFLFNIPLRFTNSLYFFYVAHFNSHAFLATPTPRAII